MRLAYCVRAIFPQHGYGGLERAAIGLMRNLLINGADIDLHTRPLPPGEPLAASSLAVNNERAGHLTVRAVRYGRLPLKPNGIPARLTNYRAFAEGMGRKVRATALSGRIDGIYAQGLCTWGVRAASEWGVPLVANPQGMEEFKVRDPLKRLAYAPFRAWLREGYRAADRVVATDFSLEREVSALLGVDPRKVVVLPNGVDLEELRSLVTEDARDALMARWPVLGHREMLLGISVGRMEANKGFEHLLRAIASVQNDLVSEWRWFIVGDGSLRQQLRELATSLGLEERIVFTGKLADPELHTLYSMCNLFAHPTLYEGSSLVTLEAMAHALPVIASSTGGIPDKVVEGETGFLVPPGDEAALAQRIVWMSDHQAERAEMGRRGARLAEDNFSWRKIATDTKELFLELVENKSACRGQEVTKGSC